MIHGGMAAVPRCEGISGVLPSTSQCDGKIGMVLGTDGHYAWVPRALHWFLTRGLLEVLYFLYWY